MAEIKPIVVVEKLVKEFGDGDSKVTVLKSVNLEIHAGEYVIFFGPSGCGKSTLLNCITGLEIPTSGSVVLRGENLSKLNQKELAKIRNKKIGMIFQQFNVIKSFNVLKNVALPQLLAGVPRRRRFKRARDLLHMLGIEKFAKRIPTELSGGQQQRVAIARALANNPWILVVDEPTGSLDSKAANEVMELIEIINKKSRRTVILVTHNPDCLKYADTVHYMKDGNIVRTKKQRHISRFEEKEFEDIRIE
jgi:putative ABC transport system ATP-binding protein